MALSLPGDKASPQASSRPQPAEGMEQLTLDPMVKKPLEIQTVVSPKDRGYSPTNLMTMQDGRTKAFKENIIHLSSRTSPRGSFCASPESKQPSVQLISRNSKG